MSETPLLGLPLLAPEQAQKHFTHNDALRALDAIVQLAVLDRDLTTPPGSPGDGDLYVVAASATDDWAGHDGEIAAWQDGAWAFHAPEIGWRAWVADESALLIWTGAAWSDLTALISALQDLALLGIGTTADATNPLSAKLNNALWTAKYDAEGGDGSLRTKMNKETAADVLSILMQTGYSGRAEVGLIGDDDLLFKVSPDGTTWYEAIRLDKDSGSITLLDAATSIADTGALLKHDPSADAHYNGFKWGLYYGTYPVVGGGVGGEDYANAVWGFGINWGNANGRLDATKAAIGWALESKYYPGTGSVYNSEAHLQFYDSAGNNHRIITGAFPHSGSGGGQLAFEFDILNFLDWSGAQRIKWDFTSGAIDLTGTPALSIRAASNNYAFIQQRNAANSAYINLMYVDSHDRAVINAPFFVTGAVESSTADFMRVQPTSMTTGDHALRLPLPVVTGAVDAIFAQGSVSAGVSFYLDNVAASAAGAYAQMRLRTTATGGDPFLHVGVVSGTDYAVGIDNDDSDAFVISNFGAPGTNNRLRIDANSVAFGLPAKLKSYTVATVPSASAAGGGANIYVSDESGGAIPAFSDGTNWRRYTDRAVIS
jgi:Protein of unknown function (DUF2793)